MKNVLLGILLITYPFAVYFGLPYAEPYILAIVFSCVFIIRYFVSTNSNNKTSVLPHFKVLAITVLSLLFYSGYANSALALKFYPVVVNLSFFVIFAFSLYKPPSVIEIIARLKDKLDDKGVAYTHKVTQIWCLFFILNASIASWTIFHPDPEIWLIYNGFVAYVLMGILMLGELVYRKFAKAKQNTSKEA